MVGIYGIIGEFSRGKSPGTVDAVGFWPTASILFCFYGAGGRARTGTVSLPVDFESTTSTNSITPAWECGTLYSIIQSPEKCKHNFSGTLSGTGGNPASGQNPYFSRITGQFPSSRALRTCSAAAWGVSLTCSPVAIFFTEHIPSAISSSPSSTAKGTASLLA